MNVNKEHTIGLLGQGIIYQHMQRSIENVYQVIPLSMESPLQHFATCSIVVSCSDTWSPCTLQEINCRCLKAAVALLPIYTQFDKGIIGPCIVPGEKGCASCAEFRKLGATASDAECELLRQYLFTPYTTEISQPWLSPFSAGMLTVLGTEEINACLQNPDQLKTQRALLTISLETLECNWHPFLPLSTCPACGKLANDSAEMAVITLQSCPKPDVYTYRTRKPLVDTKELTSTYLDQQTGLVHALTVEQRNVLPLASSQLYAESNYENETAQGTGCTLRTQQSMIVSLLEVVERYAGLRPRGKRAMVWASYQQLMQEAQPALDPTTLGLHSPEQYERYQQHHYCHHLVPYHPDLICNWVWGYSFQRQSPILVPEHCAYYGIPTNDDNPAFVYEISNGCALGNCLEEAIFHGIMEVIERDAFLLTWYAQLKLPRLDLLSVTDPTIRMLIERLEQHFGYTIHVFNASLDHALPCLCLLAIDEQQREGMPKAHFMAGSHPHPEQALLRALRELTAALAIPPLHYQQSRAQALKMLDDASCVETLEDHPLIYYLPEAFERLHFLYHGEQQYTFQEAFNSFYQHPSESMDLRDDLVSLINSYLTRGTDIVVIDQTAPEHEPCRLRCVKVLMPGMLPMTFGQHNRRVNLERLRQIPASLGYRSQPLTEAEINPHPHPFF
ncbi:YcaO-like family protein [Ktedonobacteria bacterium brp13]|nr:YcaO-like family protein [Ktedonobacteria bacterium brp13]